MKKKEKRIFDRVLNLFPRKITNTSPRKIKGTTWFLYIRRGSLTICSNRSRLRRPRFYSISVHRRRLRSRFVFQSTLEARLGVTTWSFRISATSTRGGTGRAGIKFIEIHPRYTSGQSARGW